MDKVFERKIEKRILDYFSSDDAPILLIEGVRQCGKTYVVERLGTERFKHFVKVNMVQDSQGPRLFENVRTVEDLYFTVQAVAGKELGTYDDTLVFLDEIQEYRGLFTLLKFLRADRRYRFIASGSLLGVELRRTPSIPIGSIDIVRMHPMDFEEFLWANGVQKSLISGVREQVMAERGITDGVHKRFMELFRDYLICGGLPYCVNVFLEKRDIVALRDAQGLILELYGDDASKYDEENRMHTKAILDLIPSNIENKRKRIFVKDIEDREDARFSDYADDFDCLVDSGVVLLTTCCSNPVFPLIQSAKRNLLKLYMADVGLLTGALYGYNAMALRDEGRNVDLGTVYECYAATQLAANGQPLYYTDNKRLGEVDFIIDDFTNLSTIALEIKSGKYYSKHSALDKLLESEYSPGLGIVLSNSGEVRREGKVLYLPIYALMFIDSTVTSTKKRRSRSVAASGPVVDLCRLAASEPDDVVEQLVQDVPASLRSHEASPHEVHVPPAGYADLDVRRRVGGQPPLQSGHAVAERRLHLPAGALQGIGEPDPGEVGLDLSGVRAVGARHAPRCHAERPDHPLHQRVQGGRIALGHEPFGVEPQRGPVVVHQHRHDLLFFLIYQSEGRDRVAQSEGVRYLRHEAPGRAVSDRRPDGQSERRRSEPLLQHLRRLRAVLRTDHDVEARGPDGSDLLGGRQASGDAVHIYAHRRQEAAELLRPGLPAGVGDAVPEEVDPPAPSDGDVGAPKERGHRRVVSFREPYPGEVGVQHHRIQTLGPRESGVVGAYERGSERVHKKGPLPGDPGHRTDAFGDLLRRAEHDVVVVQVRAGQPGLPAEVLRSAARPVLLFVGWDEVVDHYLGAGPASAGPVDHRVRHAEGFRCDHRSQETVGFEVHSPASHVPAGMRMQSARVRDHSTAPSMP